MITAALSKYVIGSMPAPATSPGDTVSTAEYAQAAVVPSTTSVLMLADAWRAARHAAT